MRASSSSTRRWRRFLDLVLSGEAKPFRASFADLVNKVPGFRIDPERDTYRGRVLVAFRCLFPGDRRPSAKLSGVAAMERLRRYGWAEAAVRHFNPPPARSPSSSSSSSPRSGGGPPTGAPMKATRSVSGGERPPNPRTRVEVGVADRLTPKTS